ncbi:hypothetical protein EDC01DRAFT_628955 [Geopyxis carbonaria]|nr:hypothetical protein EDC01DRAFT_628955 [Geopyxis carbonaria]
MPCLGIRFNIFRHRAKPAAPSHTNVKPSSIAEADPAPETAKTAKAERAHPTTTTRAQAETAATADVTPVGENSTSDQRPAAQTESMLTPCSRCGVLLEHPGYLPPGYICASCTNNRAPVQNRVPMFHHSMNPGNPMQMAGMQMTGRPNGPGPQYNIMRLRCCRCSRISEWRGYGAHPQPHQFVCPDCEQRNAAELAAHPSRRTMNIPTVLNGQPVPMHANRNVLMNANTSQRMPMNTNASILMNRHVPMIPNQNIPMNVHPGQRVPMNANQNVPTMQRTATNANGPRPAGAGLSGAATTAGTGNTGVGRGGTGLPQGQPDVPPTPIRLQCTGCRLIFNEIAPAPANWLCINCRWKSLRIGQNSDTPLNVETNPNGRESWRARVEEWREETAKARNFYPGVLVPHDEFGNDLSWPPPKVHEDDP